MACPRGDLCDRCEQTAAVVEIHWRAWVQKLCTECAVVMWRETEHPPIHIFPLTEQPLDAHKWGTPAAWVGVQVGHFNEV